MQMLIWEYAAIPRGHIDLSRYFGFCFGSNDDENMKNFVRLISKKQLPFWRGGSYGADLTGGDHVLEKRRFRITSHSGNKLLTRCCLSRQVILEMWRKDLGAMFRENEGRVLMATNKVRVMRVLDRLIK